MPLAPANIGLISITTLCEGEPERSCGNAARFPPAARRKSKCSRLTLTSTMHRVTVESAWQKRPQPNLRKQRWRLMIRPGSKERNCTRSKLRRPHRIASHHPGGPFRSAGPGAPLTDRTLTQRTSPALPELRVQADQAMHGDEHVVVTNIGGRRHDRTP